MKIHLNDNTYLHRSAQVGSSTKEHESGVPKSKNVATKIKHEDEYKINTTASKNTRGRTSFKGNSVSSTFIKEADELSNELGKKISPWMVKYAQKLENSEKLKNACEFASNNSVLAEALFAILITCGLRPAVIMASPGKGETKEKNQYAAAHSIASGIIGLVTTILISQPIKKAVKNLDQKKLFGGIEEIVEDADKKKVINGTKNVLERIHNPVFLPLRAMATISLIPVILGAFGIKKSSGNKQKDVTTPQNMQILMQQDTKKVFQSFAGVSQHENK